MSVMMAALSQTVSDAVGPITQSIEEPPENPLRLASDIAGGLMSVFNLPQDLLNTGFAVATNAIAQALPSFPAATLGSMYIGVPHGHMHPPSLVPPAPVPVPLPSIGAVTLGTCVQVLICSMPAARAGDLGFAPTCCGFFPAFEIVTGSSKVFIGGARAARMTDLCKACLPSIGGPVRGLAKAMAVAGNAISLLGIGADVVDSVAASDAAMSSAHAISAAMQAAQMAADAVAMAISSTMGSDPAVPPLPISGSILMGMPNVLIGGFPMPNFPNPAEMLLEKLGSLKKKKKSENGGCGKEGEPVDVVTGANVDDFLDYQLPGPLGLEWRRYYSSAGCDEDGPMGRGFRHHYDRRLRFDLDGFCYEGPDRTAVSFPPIVEDRLEAAADGLTLRRLSATSIEVREYGGPTLEFDLPRGHGPAILRRLTRGRHSLELHYDRQLRLSRLMDDAGRTVLLSYDETGHLTEVRLRPADGSAEVRLARYRYDRAGCLLEWEDATGQRAQYHYDARHRMARKTDRRGYSFHYAYDDAGRCVLTRGDDGLYEERFEFHPNERFTLQYSHLGGVWQHFYDENGTILKRVDPYGGELTRKQNAAGQVIEEVDSGGSVTQLLYSDSGRHIARVGPFGDVHPPLEEEPHPRSPLEHRMPSTPREWRHGGLLPAPRSLPTRDDPVLCRFVDVLETGVTPCEAVVPGNPWAGRRDIPTRTEVRGDTWTWQRLDGLGRVVEEVDTQGRRRRFQYDAQGRLVVREEPDGSLERWRYDGEGNILAYQDRDGATRQSRHTSWNLLEQEIDGLGLETRYAYNARELVTRVVDPGCTVSEYEYDAKDRLVKVVRCGRVRETYRWGLGDDLLEKRDGEGRLLLSFEYGPDHLKSARHLADGEVHKLEHDARGRIIRAKTSRSDTERAFDFRGRRLLEHRDGRGVEHRYSCGQLAETVYFGHYPVRFMPDGTGGLEITDPTGGVHRFQVSAAGLVARHHPNGVAELSQFDEAGRCRVMLRLKRGADAWIRREIYRYSPAGDLIEIDAGADGLRQFAYDAAHRLVGERRPDGTEVCYRYDAAGNLLEKPGLYGVSLRDGNRLRQASSETIEYDHRERVARRSGANGETTYHYDARDQLVEVRTPAGTWQAGYDPLGRRVAKVWNGERTEFWWDGDRLSAEKGPTGVLRLYLYPDEVSLVPFMLVEYDEEGTPASSGRCFYLRTDHLGQVVGVEDAEGLEVWSAELEPYGLLRSERGTFHQPLRWPGHWYDAEIGLHYNRFRYYSPALGRYLQPDPLGLAGGLNLYAYCSSPLTKVDLRGLHDDQPPKKKDDGEGEDGSDSEQTPKPKDSDEAVADIEAEYRKKIDDAPDQQAADDLRYERYQKICEAEGKTPQSREKWQQQTDRLRENSERGRREEQAALDDLGIANNNDAGNRTEYPHIDEDGTVVRPDGVTETHVIDVKATNQEVFYDTGQLRSERAGGINDTPPKTQAVILVNDDASAVRPSGPLAENATVFHRDSTTGQWSVWDSESGSWTPVDKSEVQDALGVTP